MPSNWKNPSVLRLIETSGNNDPINEIKIRSENLVGKALQKGWSGPPFNPFELAELLKIDIVPNDAIVEAQISPLPQKKFLIEYNPHQKQQRINFSISHEIIHTLFPDCYEKIRNRDKKESDTWELEMLCDIGASEILLPLAVFAQEANEMELNLNNLIKLANKYNASLEAVFLRVTEVIEKPCAMCIASFDKEKILRVDYYKNSRTFKNKLKKGYKIPKYSKAYECINPGWTDNGKEKWDPLGNILLDFYFIGLGPLKKQKLQRVGILMVPIDNISKINIKAINYILGDASQPRGEGPKIIAQIVNTSIGHGFGFGRSMTIRYPSSIKVLNEWKKNKKEFYLGNSKLTRLTDDIYVFQMLAQEGIRGTKGRIPLRYESLRKCLKKLAETASSLGASIHMPPIGSGQAQGDWSIIEGMIYEELVLNDINVTVYKLPGTEITTKQKHTLTLFDEE